MNKLLVVLSIVLFASIAFANTVEIRLDGVAAAGIHINEFSLNFYPEGSEDPGNGTYQYPEDVTDFSFSWADPLQVTRVVWTLDNYPYNDDGVPFPYYATGYAISGPGTVISALNDGLVVTLESTVANFGINPSDLSNYICGVAQGNTNLIGSTLQVEEQWVNATNQIITISPLTPSSCPWDIEPAAGDNDVDGLDLDAAAAMTPLSPAELMALAEQFGTPDCSSNG